MKYAFTYFRFTFIFKDPLKSLIHIRAQLFDLQISFLDLREFGFPSKTDLPT